MSGSGSCFKPRLFQRGRTEYKEYNQTSGLKRTKRRVTDGRRGRNRTETTGERRDGCSSSDSRYLIIDIASLLVPSLPLFLPHPEQMFAPCCCEQIAV